MKKIGEVWRDMSDEDKAKWRADGEEGSRVPGSNLAVSHMAAPSPSSYQVSPPSTPQPINPAP